MKNVNSPEQHIWSAAPEKRYIHFIHTVADRQAVWMIKNKDGELSFEENGKIHICVWPSETFAKMYLQEEAVSDNNLDESPFSVEIDTFLETASRLSNIPTYGFMVFPTQNDTSFVSPASLIRDLNEELERY